MADFFAAKINNTQIKELTKKFRELKNNFPDVNYLSVHFFGGEFISDDTPLDTINTIQMRISAESLVFIGYDESGKEYWTDTVITETL